jgi:hypothetical protein
MKKILKKMVGEPVPGNKHTFEFSPADSFEIDKKTNRLIPRLKNKLDKSPPQ